MPTPLADGSIVLLTALGTANGQRLMQTSHYRYNNPGGWPDYTVPLGELIDIIQLAGDYQDDLRAIAHSSWTLDAWVAQPVYPTRLQKISRNVGLPGSVGGTGTPQNVCPVITRKGAVAARYSISAWHGPPVAATSMVGGVLTAGLIAALDDIGADLIETRTLATSGTMTAVIWSPATPARITELETTETQDTARVMRRRTVRVGI